MSDNLLSFDDEFATDPKKVEEGIRVPYKSAFLVICHTGRRSFQNAVALYHKKYPTEESRDNEEAEAYWQSLLARHILVDWSGFNKPYSYEEAKRVLKHAALRAYVLETANKVSNYKTHHEETERKN